MMNNQYILKVQEIKKIIDECDAIVIGAGAGLSTAAGLTYSGQRFQKYFSQFIDKYHFQDMYSAGFYPFQTLEEYWAYWSLHIYYNRYIQPPYHTYDFLYDLIKDKNYFVITTNVDHQFYHAGFDKKRIFATQGDYGLLQCSKPCHQKTYNNEKIIKEMIKNQTHLKISDSLIPYCPICHAPMTVHLRCDETFVQDSEWYASQNRYFHFLNQVNNGYVVYLELGVGYNTPGIIKYPFWQYTYQNKNAKYICINQEDAIGPTEIDKQSLFIKEDIHQVINDLREMRDLL